MSAQSYQILQCDAPGCGESFLGVARVGETRAMARNAGWSYGIRRGPNGGMASADYCPCHRSEADGLELPNGVAR